LYKKYKNTTAKYLVYFLIYTCFVELIGRYPIYLIDLGKSHLTKNTLIESNYWWFAIFWNVGLASFITLINYKIIYNSNFKKLLKYSYYAYIVQFILYTVFNFPALFDPSKLFLDIISTWIIVLAIVLYLFDYLQSTIVSYH